MPDDPTLTIREARDRGTHPACERCGSVRGPMVDVPSGGMAHADALVCARWALPTAVDAGIAELGSELRVEYRRRYGNSPAWHVSVVGPFARPSECLRMRVIDEYRIVGEWRAIPAAAERES